MKFNLSNLSAVLLASGMLMSTAVTAAPGDATQFGGADTDWSTVDYPRLTDMDDNVDSMGGKIRFTGRVVKATCKVATDSKQIEGCPAGCAFQPFHWYRRRSDRGEQPDRFQY